MIQGIKCFSKSIVTKIPDCSLCFVYSNTSSIVLTASKIASSDVPKLRFQSWDLGYFKQVHSVALFKGARSRLKSLAKLFKFVVCNPYQSSPSLTILVPLWFIIISLMFFFLYKVLFLGFLQFSGYFFDVQNNSRCRD